MIKLRIYTTLLVIAVMCSLSSCSDDDNDSPTINDKLIAPSRIEVAIDQNNGIAKIIGFADPNVDVHLKYKDVNGTVLKNSRTESSGHFTFQVDLLIGYDQQFEVYTSIDNKGLAITSKETSVPLITSKDRLLELTNDQVINILTVNRWKSDQTTSRILIRQTATTPPYDMFATVAQKFFDFKVNGDFHFEVTAPLQFTHTVGSWKINKDGIMDINTMIPLGAMQIQNIRIQHIDENRLSLLTNISDGLFLLSFVKE